MTAKTQLFRNTVKINIQLIGKWKKVELYQFCNFNSAKKPKVSAFCLIFVLEAYWTTNFLSLTSFRNVSWKSKFCVLGLRYFEIFRKKLENLNKNFILKPSKNQQCSVMLQSKLAVINNNCLQKIFVFRTVQRFLLYEQLRIRNKTVLNQSWSSLNVSNVSEMSTLVGLLSYIFIALDFLKM